MDNIADHDVWMDKTITSAPSFAATESLCQIMNVQRVYRAKICRLSERLHRQILETRAAQSDTDLALVRLRKQDVELRKLRRENAAYRDLLKKHKLSLVNIQDEYCGQAPDLQPNVVCLEEEINQEKSRLLSGYAISFRGSIGMFWRWAFHVIFFPFFTSHWLFIVHLVRQTHSLCKLSKMGLFGKEQVNPRDQVREWSRKCRQEMRTLDRQIHQIQREEEKVKKSLKDAAKKGDRDVCTILAKEVVRSRKAVSKLYTSKAQINSVIMNMQHQAATVRMAGSLQKSTEVMQSMQRLVRVPEIAATMRELSKEMLRAGIIEEMIEDTMEGMEPEDMEEEAQSEVDKVLWEITAGELGRAPAAVTESLPATGSKQPAAKAKTPVAAAAASSNANFSDEDQEDDMTEMQARLQSLRS